MTDKHKFSKPVAFNINNPTDKAIVEYVKRRNFSGYVKKLIMEDMKSKGIDVPKRKKTERPSEVAVQPTETKLERLKRQLKSAKNVSDNSNGNPDT